MRSTVSRLSLGTLLLTGALALVAFSDAPKPKHGAAPSDEGKSLLAATTGSKAQLVGEGIGIQVQPWYIKEGDLAAIYGAGFRVVRWGISWDRIETIPGKYDWSDMDRFMRELKNARLRSVIILGYGNPLYTGSLVALSRPGQLIEASPPVTVASRNAFAQFAAAAAFRYRNESVTWEIWNEPDLATFWHPKPDPAAYAALATQSCKAIRAAAPGAKIFGGVGAALPNVVSSRPNIYSALAQNGAINCLSGVSAHAYRMNSAYLQPDPESVVPDIKASRTYLYSKLKIPSEKVFAVTEWGFTTKNLSPNLQAAYFVRANLINSALGVPLTIWYEWRDSRTDKDDPESHFGLLTTYGAQKNALNVQNIVSRISGARFIRTLQANNSNIYVLQFADESSNFLVAWKRSHDERDLSVILVNGTVRSTVSFMPAIIELGASQAESVVVE